jgi:hypothetical protein
MVLYDFATYAKRRDVRNAAQAVAGIVVDINQPGRIVELKIQVNHWFALHQEVLKQATGT